MFTEEFEAALKRLTPKDKPFYTEAWRLWQENQTWPMPPKGARQHLRNLALQGRGRFPPMTPAEVNKAYPADYPELAAQTAVYKSWEDGVKQYNPRVLHEEIGITTRFKHWMAAKRIPPMLNFREYWFLSEYLIATGHRNRRLDPDTYEHLAPLRPNLGRKFKSKIGNTYGNWVLMALTSESETVRPLYYRAMCQACGHTIEKFNYSRVGQPCGNCLRLAKVYKVTETPRPLKPNEELASAIVVWQTSEGWIAQAERPEGATAKLVIEGVGKLTALERLEGESMPNRYLEEQPVEELSAYAKSIKTLDIPEF